MNEKITILTGAGASFGCGNTSPYNPPLGRDLYVELEKHAPQIMSQLSNVIGRDGIENFEEKMHQAWQSNKVNGIIINAAIASYFSRFNPGVGNAFVSLFKDLDFEKIDYVYSTLNYDCLAELAATKIGLQTNYVPKNMPTKQFDVLKLHGSCNFLFKGITGKLGMMKVGMKGGTLDGTVEPVQPSLVSTLIQNRPAGPCMSYYMKNKPTSVGPSTIREIQNKWKEVISKSDKLVIIGTNVNTDDSHIWEPITGTRAKIGFVGSPNAFSVLESLGSDIDATHLSSDFDASISDIVNFVK